MYFSTNVSFASLPVFLPIILEELGYSSINAQGLSAPPYFLSFLITVSSVWVADRTQQRGYFIIALSMVGCIGYIILATVESVGARYCMLMRMCPSRLELVLILGQLQRFSSLVESFLRSQTSYVSAPPNPWTLMLTHLSLGVK